MAALNATLKTSGCYYGENAQAVATLECVPVLLGTVIFWAILFAGVVALIFIILGGIKLITSGGDPKQVDGARKTITFAVIGLIMVLFSFAIVNFVAKTTGVGCISVRKLSLTECAPD